MYHKCIPKSMTKENLAKWITENSTEKQTFEQKIPLTEMKIRELEHKSSLASRALDALKKIEDEFKGFMKKGTPVNPSFESSEVEYLPVTITIPPTKGVEALKANREFADALLAQGYEVEVTPIYLIAWPEKSKMVGMDIEGVEFVGFTRDMTSEEELRFGNLFKEEKDEVKAKSRKSNPFHDAGASDLPFMDN